jgi:hypothetical protein
VAREPEVQFNFCATVAVGKFLEPAQAGFEMRQRFVIRRAISVSLARSQAEFHRLLGIAAMCVVIGQFGQVIVQAAWVQRLKGSSDSLMQRLAPLDQDLIVSDLARISVLEAVLGIARRGPLVYELGELKLVEHRLKLVLGLVDNLAG